MAIKPEEHSLFTVEIGTLYGIPAAIAAALDMYRGDGGWQVARMNNQSCQQEMQETREIHTYANIVDLRGVQPSLLKCSLQKDEYFQKWKVFVNKDLEECMQELVDRSVLELSLLSPSNSSPFGKRYDDIVWSLLKNVSKTVMSRRGTSSTSQCGVDGTSQSRRESRQHAGDVEEDSKRKVQGKMTLCDLRMLKYRSMSGSHENSELSEGRGRRSGFASYSQNRVAIY